MFGGGFFGGGDGGGFFPGVPERFDHQYQAFPVSFIGREDLEKGNKLILPQSALDHLARLNISYPMLFSVSHPSRATQTHAGVQEFIADEGMCYLPYWMMQNLLLKEGDLVHITNTSLPKGSFVKLQPVSSDFLDIHNPRAVLENSLRNFATLTVGDCIVIDYNSKKYEIEIIECKPAKAISIIEADVNVDFAPPKDYKEPTRPSDSGGGNQYQNKEEAEQEPEPMEEEPASKLFGGSGQRVDGKAIKAVAASPALAPSAAPDLEELEDLKMPWRKRLTKGVKLTDAPYGFNTGHMSAQKGAAPLPPPQKDLWAGGGSSLQ